MKAIKRLPGIFFCLLLVFSLAVFFKPQPALNAADFSFELNDGQDIILLTSQIFAGLFPSGSGETVNALQAVQRLVRDPETGPSYTFGLSSGNNTGQVPANSLNVAGYRNTAGDGKITRVEILVDDPGASGKIRMGVYTSTPVLLIQDLGEARVMNGWVAFDGLDIPVKEGSDYGLGFILEDSTGIRIHDQEPYWCYSAGYPYGPLPFGEWTSNDVPPGGMQLDYRFVIKVTVSGAG